MTFRWRHTAQALAILGGLALASLTPARAEEPRTDQAVLLGTAWYPEQWPESRWDADLALMEQAHVRFVRIAEFAWSTLEPREGDFQLDWLARAVRAAERHHIGVVLGTPSATPPAWLTSTYPQTLRTLADGRQAVHGARQQADWASPLYRQLVARIVTRMADRFGHDPNVIGWQIDNEYDNDSHDEATRVQFQDWLKARYGTLDALNARWTTAYWSETYQDWRQIPIPPEHGGNPGLMLNWRLFVTDTWRSYQKGQLDILRPRIDARQKITTNFYLWDDRIDQNIVVKDLDFASWDNYVGSGHFKPANKGLVNDAVRGYLRQNFWVMETQPGTVNWADVSSSLDKGEVRAMAWNAVGHGADAVAYWQWRSALNGQEQYHGTLLGPDGTPVPVYDEARQIGAEFAKASPSLAGTTVHSDVALLADGPSRWAISWQPHNKNFDVFDAMVAYYAPLHDLARSVDVVPDTAPLAGYKLVTAPALNLITPEAAANLIAYVRGGGHLVLGVRSGMKDADNSLQTARQPGPLAALLGARVSQFYALEQPVPVDGRWGAAKSALWAERLEVTAPDAEVLMRYGPSNGWLDGQPAVVTRKVGQGRITYIGANLDVDGMKAAVAWMTSVSGVAPVMPDLPADVDVAIRSGQGRRVMILTNYGQGPRTIPLPPSTQDVLTGAGASSTVLARYGVAVLQLGAWTQP